MKVQFRLEDLTFLDLDFLRDTLRFSYPGMYVDFFPPIVVIELCRNLCTSINQYFYQKYTYKKNTHGWKEEIKWAVWYTFCSKGNRVTWEKVAKRFIFS